ncbi:MAG: YqgE/AlgH family protein [Spirochaetales bacterium]
MNAEPESLSGQFLIADLDLTDPSFLRSVVLVVEHNAEGAFGLIINRPLGLTAAQIVQENAEPVEFPERRGKIPLYGGGPVENQAVFTLHSGLEPSSCSPAVREIAPGLFFEPSFPAVRRYVSGIAPEYPPDDTPTIRLYLGYAGWGEGQLEAERRQGSWHLLPARASLVFQTPPQDIWQRAMELKGGFWSIVAQTGFKPSLN